MNGVSVGRPRAEGTAGLYLRCVLWGIATGAAVGGVMGALVPVVADPTFLLLGLVAGVVIGALVAVLPSLVGAAVVTAVVRARHPHPASEDDVRRDVGTLCCAVVGTLDALLLVAIFLGGGGFSSVLSSLPYVAAGTASAALVLWPARTSIARAWVYR